MSDVFRRCYGSKQFIDFTHTRQVCVCVEMDLPNSASGFTPTISTLCSKNVLCASSWSLQFIEFFSFSLSFLCVEKWNGLIMHDI